MKHDYTLGDCGYDVKLRKSCYPTLSTTNLPLPLCSVSSGMHCHISQALSYSILLYPTLSHKPLLKWDKYAYLSLKKLLSSFHSEHLATRTRLQLQVCVCILRLNWTDVVRMCMDVVLSHSYCHYYIPSFSAILPTRAFPDHRLYVLALIMSCNCKHMPHYINYVLYSL